MNLPRMPLLVAAASLSFSAAAAPRRIEITPDDQFAWSCYMICFAVSRDYTATFYDRPLNRPATDGSNPRLIDLRNAAAAGFDGLSVDLFIKDRNAFGAFLQLVNLVNEHELPIGLSPMFDGFGRPGVTTDDVVVKVSTWFKRFAAEPCVVRCQGRPVILTYAPYALPPEQWRTILSRLHDAGCDGYWVGEFARHLVLGTEPKFDLTRPWLELFQGASTFPPMDLERTVGILKQYRECRPDGCWVGSTRIGYWRPEVAVYASPQGTRTYRESWATIREAGITWVQQATWNDFSENHHIMPSENYSTTFVELSRHLMREWKGLPSDLAGPRLCLSQQQEVCAGEDAQFELLAMLRPKDAPARLELRLLDATGREVKSCTPATVSASGVQAADFAFRVESVPKGRLLLPEAKLITATGETVHIRGPCTIVSPGGYRPERNYSWLYTPAHRQADGVACEFTLDGSTGDTMAQTETKGSALVRATSSTPLADVEVLRNGAQVHSMLRHAPDAPMRSPVEHRVRLSLNRRGLLDWGAYAARAVTRDGRVATSRPVFVERPESAGVTVGHYTFDNDAGADALDSSPWLHDGRLGGRPRYKAHRPGYAADPWGGKCLSFDGIDDRVLLDGPIVPPNTYTVECWLKWRGFVEAGPSSQLIFATANAAVVLGISKQGTLRVSRHSGGRWWAAQDRHRVAPDTWYHVAATYDGATLRLYRDHAEVADASAPGQSRCGQVSIGWNSVTHGAFFHGLIDEVRVSANALAPAQFGPKVMR